MTQRVLVAGSSGGIGAELARQLRAAGYTVFTLSRSGAVRFPLCSRFIRF